MKNTPESQEDTQVSCTVEAQLCNKNTPAKREMKSIQHEDGRFDCSSTHSALGTHSSIENEESEESNHLDLGGLSTNEAPHDEEMGTLPESRKDLHLSSSQEAPPTNKNMPAKKKMKSILQREDVQSKCSSARSVLCTNSSAENEGTLPQAQANVHLSCSKVAPHCNEHILFCLMKDRCDEEKAIVREDRQIIRTMIFQENKLFQERKTHFALLQGLLWASASLLLQIDSKRNADLAYVLAAIGVVAAMDAVYCLGRANMAVQRLFAKFPEGDVGTYPEMMPVIGLTHEMFETRWPLNKFILSHNHMPYVPVTFAIGWIAFCIVLSNR